tara:strand:- start:18731 stop:19618 length:888 start_codon:yes stop_codon:yes gene_type:complete
MNRLLRKALVVCLLGSFTNVSVSQQDTAPVLADIVISSGVEGGGYWSVGSRLQAVAGGMGLTVQNQASIGSLANLRELMKEGSPVSLAFVQQDALQYYLDSKPRAVQAIEALENIGQECVFIITDSKGDIDTVEDMQKASRMQLGIKSPNSGIRVTFDYMASLAPGLGDITVNYGNAVDMMNGFAHPLTNIKRAVMVVHAPDAHSPEIDMVIANPDRFRFVEIRDERFTRKTASGEAIYHSMKVAPGAVEGAGSVQTICVQGLLVANKNKLTAEQREKVIALIDNHWSQVRPDTE